MMSREEKRIYQIILDAIDNNRVVELKEALEKYHSKTRDGKAYFWFQTLVSVDLVDIVVSEPETFRAMLRDNE